MKRIWRHHYAPRRASVTALARVAVRLLALARIGPLLTCCLVSHVRSAPRMRGPQSGRRRALPDGAADPGRPGGTRIVPIASCPRGAGSTSIDSPGGQATPSERRHPAPPVADVRPLAAARSVLRYASAVDASLRRRCSNPRNGKWRISSASRRTVPGSLTQWSPWWTAPKR